MRACDLQTWRRPTFPRLETKYHRRWSVSRPSSGWDRVQPLRWNHQVGKWQVEAGFWMGRSRLSVNARQSPLGRNAEAFRRPIGLRGVRTRHVAVYRLDRPSFSAVGASDRHLCREVVSMNGMVWPQFDPDDALFDSFQRKSAKVGR